ncbi:MAG: gamma-glutamyltransferase [Planctomycetes bacterium]|nr:gamma-glutamyltransferase [Planctomycetota bacterium]
MAHSATHDTPKVNPAAAAEGNVVLAFTAALAIAAFGLVASAQKSGSHAPEAAKAGVQVATGKEVAVATAAPEASDAALTVLIEGGNAYDALVASSFVISVVRPQSTGIGGGGFVLHYDAEMDAVRGLDGREAAPAAASPNMYLGADGEPTSGYLKGPLAAGTPGLVAMLWRLHQDHGSKKYAEAHGGRAGAWKHLLQPAIRYAKDGFRVKKSLAKAIQRKADRLRAYPISAAIFLPGGAPPEVGDLFKQKRLANTLTEIANRGADGFYKGWVAKTLAESSLEAGGILTSNDLSSYLPIDRAAIDQKYRGRRVASFPLPSSGGIILVEMLNMLEQYPVDTLEHNSADHVHLLAEIMRRAYADRSEYLADPTSLNDAERLQISRLTTDEYAQSLVAGIDVNRATPSSKVLPGLGSGDHTTHISIVDSEGNAVASTQTINTSLGSCFVAGQTGVLLNNEMNDFTAVAGKPNAFGAIQSTRNLPGPGKRPLSSMSPTIVFGLDEKPEIVVGAAGGTKIITTVFQIVSNLVDFNMSPEEAMASPRMHHQHLPDEIRLEKGLKAISHDLTKKGHKVVVKPGSICEAQLVVRKGTDLVAVSDPRGEGRPAAR